MRFRSSGHNKISSISPFGQILIAHNILTTFLQNITSTPKQSETNHNEMYEERNWPEKEVNLQLSFYMLFLNDTIIYTWKAITEKVFIESIWYEYV